MTPEELIATLPPSIQAAMEQGDQVAFAQALEALPHEEQQRVVETLVQLQEEAGGPDMMSALATFEPLLQGIAEVANGDQANRAEIEELLPQLEQNGWQLVAPVEQIWAGERDLAVLTETLDPNSAMLIGRVIEILTGVIEPEQSPQELIESLPVEIRRAMERGDGTALEAVFDALPPEEQKTVATTIMKLQRQANNSDPAARLQQFEPLLQAIARVASGDLTQRVEIEAVLADLVEKGWHLDQPVQRIWGGERDQAALTEGLDPQDTMLVNRILEIIHGG